MGAKLSDFWWLDEDQLGRFTYLKFGHNEPVDDSTSPYIKPQKCRISTIDELRSEFQNINIHRSLELSDSPSNGEKLVGPFLIDIDNENNNLESARNIIKQTLEYLTTQLYKSPVVDFRLFFTGHKGFNIEIKPSLLEINNYSNQYESLYRKKRRDIIDYLHKKNDIPENHHNFVDNNDTIIDVKHCFVRLHNSINSWVGDDGKIISRKKIELSYQEIFEMSIEDIITTSVVKI